MKYLCYSGWLVKGVVVVVAVVVAVAVAVIADSNGSNCTRPYHITAVLHTIIHRKQTTVR